MIGAKEFVAAVDKFMALPKILVGADVPQTWQRGRDDGEMCLKLPLEVEGEQLGPYLWIESYPEHPTLKFRFAIFFLRQHVCRVDFDQESRHVNNFAPAALGLPNLVKGPHWHSWEINRGLVVSAGYTRLNCAVPLDPAIKRFDPALRWYCRERRISIGRHQIELPSPGRLI